MPQSGPPLDAPIRLSNLLARGLAANPDDPALVAAERSWTWRELDQAISRYATNLLDLGLQAGDRVASLMPNRTALLLHYLACIKAGLVATPLNYRYMPPEIDHALEVSEASILLAHAERDKDVATSKLAGRLPLGVIRYGANDGRSPSFKALLEHEPSARDLPTPDPADPAFIFFTSGSTGLPKGVTHAHESLGWMFAGIAAGLELTSEDVLLPGSSISHIGGFMFSFATLSVGGRVVLARTFDGDELLPLMRTYRPTVLNMLPSKLLCLVRDHGATRKDFDSLRLCRAGGDKVSAELEREFNDLTGLMIDEGYGMTEIGLAMLNLKFLFEKANIILSIS
ncbi:MAG: class I adenylate-forming enzyme family protein [Pseudomonadota bacterium]|nr:class I adenylate-forming enzyme family protein [Pseudomonadota bacterium]